MTFCFVLIGNEVGPKDNNIKKHSDSPNKFNPILQSHSHISGKELIKKFLQNQDSILEFLDKAKAINIQSTYVPTAFYGLLRIRLGDMLKIIVYHIERHIVQAQRLLYNDNFPANTPSGTFYS